MEIIPTTIPNTDFSQVEKRLQAIKDLSTWIQIDLTDGVLVKPASYPLELFNNSHLDLSKNIFDVHLMVKEPINWLNKCLAIQASRVVGQVEMMADRELFIKTAQDNGLEAGLAFDATTPVDNNIPQDTNLILLMGRPMGFTPAPFDPQIFEKIDFFKKLGFKVAVDGGVSPDNFSQFQQAGVDIVYVGHYFLDLINEKDH